MIEVVGVKQAKENLNFYFNTAIPSSNYKDLKLRSSAGFLVFYNDCMDGIASSTIFNARGAKIFNCSTENVVFHPVNRDVPINYPMLTEKIKEKLKVKNLYLVFLDFSIAHQRDLAAYSMVPFMSIDHSSCSFGTPCYIQVVNAAYDSTAHLLSDIFQVPHSDENPKNTTKLIQSTNLIESAGISLIGKMPNEEIIDNIFGALTSYPGCFASYICSNKMSSSQVLKAVYNYVIDEVTPADEEAAKKMIDFNRKAREYNPEIEYEYNIANGVKIGAIVFSGDKFDKVYQRVAMMKAASMPYDILILATEKGPKKKYEITVMSKIPCKVGLFCENNNGWCRTNRIGTFTATHPSIMKKLNVLVEELKGYITTSQDE